MSNLRTWDDIAREALRQAVNMRCAGAVVIRSDIDPSGARTLCDSRHVGLGTVAIWITDVERTLGLSSTDLITKLLTAANPCAVGM
jgi:hypothetical protein